MAVPARRPNSLLLIASIGTLSTLMVLVFCLARANSRWAYLRRQMEKAADKPQDKTNVEGGEEAAGRVSVLEADSNKEVRCKCPTCGQPLPSDP
jgi:hypothetical protein